MKIEKGTPCFISKSGHNNFLYPIYDESGLTYFEEDVENAELKSWICGRENLKAVLVRVESIRDLYGGDSIIVWVEKKYLKDT